MATAKLWVTGMTCGHCQTKVANALKSVPGVYSAVVDLQDGEAEVDFDDDIVTADRLLAAVEHAGYKARLAG
ncbi:MAG TPA: heavy-metal-associated domain-containing protein [Gemmatimonadales bacterium]|nr:heavy-metal-associated domain-containing protein [Gemmatimonadales bacterium]